MKILMRPTIDIGSLCDAANQRYGWKMDDYDLCQILFGDDYNNDCHKTYYFCQYEKYEGYSWQNEHHIDIRNKINRYLRELLPDYASILIDVSW